MLPLVATIRAAGLPLQVDAGPILGTGTAITGGMGPRARTTPENKLPEGFKRKSKTSQTRSY